MEYKFELHCHTSESSPCGHATAAETVRAYSRLGYAGIVITDHMVIGQPEDKWEEYCLNHRRGYEAAKRIGDECGLTVLYGWETTVIPCCGNDFLTYGLDTDWLLSHPEINRMSLRKVLETYRAAGAFITHAHPLREADYIDHIALLPRLTDAAEMNANRTDAENDRVARFFAEYSVPTVCGSDNHHACGKGQKRLFAMAFPENPGTVEDLIRLMREGRYNMLMPEEAPRC